MLPNALSTAAVALVAFSLASAQTKSDCDPRKKSDCPANPALGTSVNCDFTQGECDAFRALEGTTVKYDGGKGAVFSINAAFQAPTLISKKYIFYGKVEVELQPAPFQGLITSIVLESDALDEIDWEWVGTEPGQVETNYFRGGDDGTYDRGGKHQIASLATSFHKYTLEWTKDKMEWSVDGKVVRVQTAAKAGGKFPQSPMRVRIGPWSANSQSPEGVKSWAGGVAQFDKGPFLAYYKSAAIADYAGGDKLATGGIKEYVYGDKTATHESIKVVKGDNSQNKAESKPSLSVDAGSSTSGSTTRGATSPKPTASETSASGLKSIGTNLPKTTSEAAAPDSNNTRRPNGTDTARHPNGSSTPTTSSAGSLAPHEVVSLGSLALVGALAAIAHLP